MAREVVRCDQATRLHTHLTLVVSAHKEERLAEADGADLRVPREEHGRVREPCKVGLRPRWVGVILKEDEQGSAADERQAIVRTKLVCVW